MSAAWELDFWGKFRRATEAARANLLASESARQEVMLTLVANVSGAYFQLRALDLELEISKRTLASRQESLRLTTILADHGSTSMLDVRQAEQLVFTAAAEIPALEQQIEQEENLISILLGKNPDTVAARASAHGAETSACCSGGPSFFTAGTPARHSRSGTTIDRRECSNRRRQSSLFSADLPEWHRWIPECGAHELIQRPSRHMELRSVIGTAHLHGRVDSVPTCVSRKPSSKPRCFSTSKQFKARSATCPMR